MSGHQLAHTATFWRLRSLQFRRFSFLAARVGCKGKKPGWTVLPISARTAALALSLFIWSVVERSACAGFASYLDEANRAQLT